MSQYTPERLVAVSRYQNYFPTLFPDIQLDVCSRMTKLIEEEGLLNGYGEAMGKRFARIIHALTSLPGADRFVWRHVESVMKKMSSEKLGYRSRLVSEPPEMYGVDILSCPYHELARALGDERAVLCICHMDKEYSQGFRHIRYDRNSAVSEGARACEYRLRFDMMKH